MKKIGVLGAGTMGAGIAQVLLQGGYEVAMRARRESSIESGKAKIEKNFSKMVAKEKISEADKTEFLSKLQISTELDIFKDSDIIIEATTENMEAKKELAKQIDEICKEDAIFATNTSSLSITEIAACMKHPEKVIGMHFFNPVPAMKLVEVIKGFATDEAVNKEIIEMTEKIGKTPVQVEEGPGFVVNRILLPMINEGIGILADGLASAEDIDKAMKLGAGHPMGPLALADLIGLDVCLAIMETLYSEFGDSKYRPHPLLRKMVRSNNLGMKTGKGFFEYSK
ncbi:3-hydroxyacyl-CoA dehydrogenase, NAD binding domain protein [Eubacterium saphenum ATCC 49989]|nr:3-hydroxyacyl-CoA dehydrogenase, NAD binding domain protein [Eubacterium saphenum ATCC 49989]